MSVLGEEPKIQTWNKKKEVCLNRPDHRNPRKDTAVTVYTINKESRYLILQNIPSFGQKEDILKLFAVYGEIEEYRYLDEYPTEEFTDVMWMKFKRLSNARVAKKKLDDYNYLGQLLHVSYAPQYETVEDTRAKIHNRRWEISKRKGRAPSPPPLDRPPPPIQMGRFHFEPELDMRAPRLTDAPVPVPRIPALPPHLPTSATPSAHSSSAPAASSASSATQSTPSATPLASSALNSSQPPPPPFYPPYGYPNPHPYPHSYPYPYPQTNTSPSYQPMYYASQTPYYHAFPMPLSSHPYSSLPQPASGPSHPMLPHTQNPPSSSAQSSSSHKTKRPRI